MSEYTGSMEKIQKGEKQIPPRNNSYAAEIKQEGEGKGSLKSQSKLLPPLVGSCIFYIKNQA